MGQKSGNSPVEVGRLNSPFFNKAIYKSKRWLPWGLGISEPSTLRASGLEVLG